jgi:hypothetical protein
MEPWKLMYSFQDPMGASDSKIGITGLPLVRLGVYQNSISRNSHIACFHKVYYGPSRAITLLEQAVKQRFNWDIERDGRGVSEWITGWTSDMVETKIDEVIHGYKFKIQKVDPAFLPLTADNMEDFLEHYNLVNV